MVQPAGQKDNLPEQVQEAAEFQLVTPNANAERDVPVPNEKLIETLFNAILLRCFGARISLYTPTTREEYIKGYDGSLRSEGDCREIFLQFKRARILQDGAFTIDIMPHQHEVLQARAPKTAYYIAATLCVRFKSGRSAKCNCKRLIMFGLAAYSRSAISKDTRKFHPSVLTVTP